MAKARTHYEVLGVAATATPEEIRSAYRARARELHPDLHPHKQPAALQELNAAYEVLSDPTRRATYDEGLRVPAAAEDPSPARPREVTEDEGVAIGKAVASELAKAAVRGGGRRLARSLGIQIPDLVDAASELVGEAAEAAVEHGARALRERRQRGMR